MERIHELLCRLYGSETAGQMIPRLQQLLSKTLESPQNPRSSLSHRDAFLITYANQVQEAGSPPLQSLASFCDSYMKDAFTAIHILPFYPSSSDDGFSVIDYRAVDPDFGAWSDLALLRNSFRLMFDAVINHASSQSEWFLRFTYGDPAYSNFFYTPEEEADLSFVIRPRTHPVLSAFQTVNGERKVWTTFSRDQVDLNFRNPEVLLEILDLALFYVNRGADFLRLDAIAYLWKEPGTSCIHLAETHAIIKLLRAFLDIAAPGVCLITETNVPHQDNISYFGDGTDEAHLVYNFTLPPLTLHTLITGNSRAITEWAASLLLPANTVTYFNFLASHDGIGLNPLRGILAESQIDNLANRCLQHGGLISNKRDTNGAEIPYELNISYFDALSNPDSHEPLDLQIDRFVAAHFLMFSLIGVPAVYFHSITGSRSWPEGAKETGRARTINRRKLNRSTLEADLNHPDTIRSRVFSRLRHLLEARAKEPSFDPYGKMNVLNFGDPFFAVERSTPRITESILCILNVTEENQQITLPAGVDLLSGVSHVRSEIAEFGPYQGMWLRRKTAS